MRGIGSIRLTLRVWFCTAPPLVVAHALAGTVRFDIEKDMRNVVAVSVRSKPYWRRKIKKNMALAQVE